MLQSRYFLLQQPHRRIAAPSVERIVLLVGKYLPHRRYTVISEVAALHDWGAYGMKKLVSLRPFARVHQYFGQILIVFIPLHIFFL
jgi:hypothetical protein